MADSKFTQLMGHDVSSTANLCFPTGAAQFQSCHDATGCGGNEVIGVSNSRDCCLGSGLSFRDGGTCRQCIGKQLSSSNYCSQVSEIFSICYRSIIGSYTVLYLALYATDLVYV